MPLYEYVFIWIYALSMTTCKQFLLYNFILNLMNSKDPLRTTLRTRSLVKSKSICNVFCSIELSSPIPNSCVNSTIANSARCEQQTKKIWNKFHSFASAFLGAAFRNMRAFVSPKSPHSPRSWGGEPYSTFRTRRRRNKLSVTNLDCLNQWF